MTPQIEATGNLQRSGTAPGHASSHGSAAKKGIFSTLMSIIGKQSGNRNTKPSPETTSGVRTETRLMAFTSLMKKPVIVHSVSASITGKNRLEAQKEQEHQGKESISKENVSGTEILVWARGWNPVTSNGKENTTQPSNGKDGGKPNIIKTPNNGNMIEQAMRKTANEPHPAHVQPDHTPGHQIPETPFAAVARRKTGTAGNIQSGKSEAQDRKTTLATRAQQLSEGLNPARVQPDHAPTHQIPETLFAALARGKTEIARDEANIRPLTKHKDFRFEPDSTQKQPGRHALVQQGVKTTLLTADGNAEGSSHLIENKAASIPDMHSQSATELYTLQTPSADTSSVVLTQHAHSIPPQSLPNSGPWSVAAAMREIGRAASRKQFRIELRLEPAHLGKIQVYLDSDASKQIQVHIVVDQSTSRQVIEQHLPSLRQALDQQGLDMGSFSMASQHDQHGRDSNTHGGQYMPDYAAPANSKFPEPAEPQTLVTNTRLSIHV